MKELLKDRAAKLAAVGAAISLIGLIVYIVLYGTVQRSMDSMSWQADTILFTGFGVLFPLFCAGGFLALLCSGILRKVNGKPYRQTVFFAIVLLCLLILFARLFFLIGALGIGPIPG